MVLVSRVLNPSHQRFETALRAIRRDLRGSTVIEAGEQAWRGARLLQRHDTADLWFRTLAGGHTLCALT
jgi:hypothetical protein